MMKILQIEFTLSPVLIVSIGVLLSCGQSSVGGNDSDADASDNLCGCTNDEDAVEEDVCVNTGTECNLLTPCDTGYECTPDNVCSCEDPSICGIDCSSECDCPTDYTCDDSAGVCRRLPFCLDDSMCDAGEVCRENAVALNRCGPPSGLADGESCTEDLECSSGVCEGQTCLQTCFSNGDCLQGEVCEVVLNGHLACVQTSSCFDCTAPEDICDRMDCRRNCRTSGDCADDCLVSLGNSLSGECWDIPWADCADGEFLIDHGLTGSFCVIYQFCWGDYDCPQDYSCYTSSELGNSVYTDPAFCARAL